MALSDVAIVLPDGFALGEAPVGEDRHAAGLGAARRALDALGVAAVVTYDGPRPVIADGSAAISITHGKTRALAVAARVRHLGIDLCDDDPRIPELALRYFATEHTFAKTPRQLAACLAAKEAGLKALGLGLLDGGVFDDPAVIVTSLEPPRLRSAIARLTLVIGDVPEGAVAVVYG